MKITITHNGARASVLGTPERLGESDGVVVYRVVISDRVADRINKDLGSDVATPYGWPGDRQSEIVYRSADEGRTGEVIGRE